MAHPVWPLYDLRLRTPSLELRLPTEDELVALCMLARAGVHDPSVMPFTVAWTDLPSPQFERGFFQYHMSTRGGWRPERWTLTLAAFVAGEPIGMQDLAATDFTARRQVHTGSWLGMPHHGKGYGKQMRAAVLELGFAGLGAAAAHSAALAGNAASLAVSRALGYELNGVDVCAPRGEPLPQQRLRLTRRRWHEHRWCEVEVRGLDTSRDMFGA